jgi:plastocyanin
MSPSRSILVLAAMFLVAASLVFLGCSKNKNPTSPYGGGPSGNPGGGGGAPLFDSSTLSAGANFVHTFPAAGTFGYHCNFHVSMGMTGTVTVVDGVVDSAVVVASGTSFTPSSVSVKPGGYIRWHLTDGPHTVTAN